MSDIDDVFAELGFGKMQFIILFCCLVLQIWITNEQLGIGVVLAGASCELEIHDKRLAWLMAGNFTAQMLSCFLWGQMSDVYGRRKVILTTAIGSNILSILSAFMPEYWGFFALRVLAGFFLSASVVCCLTYLSEFTKISLRPRVLTIMSYAIGLSLIYVPSLAGAVLPLHIKPSGWRILLVCNQLPGVIGIIILIFLPESPKYYLSVGKQEKAMKVMERVCRMNKGKNVTLESLGVNSLTQPRLRNMSKYFGPCQDIRTLMTKYVKIMCIFIYVFFALSGLSFSLPIWMLRIRVLTSHLTEPLTVCDHLKGKTTSTSRGCYLTYEEMEDPLIHGFVVLLLFIVTSLLLICLNRRTIILLYVAIAMLGCVTLNFMKHPTLILISFFAIIDPPTCCIRLTSSLLIDLVPTHLRGKAFALTTMMGRCGVLITSLYVGYTLSHVCYVTFNIFILVLIVCGILVYWLPAEYRRDSFTA
ncbi:synaptic vesicle 2-related protein isoform X1 [Drosophila subpulchrella]|uniref:synaptic vesicle 2-related protein isoform X1 n=1 Tax=Drosophila subpulchrella TaxID=1486046 RepID=UPI0018A19EA5|nr:synaptic vesicle 2-related protein isoform X1 [Drosophila subpulchrella]